MIFFRFFLNQHGETRFQKTTMIFVIVTLIYVMVRQTSILLCDFRSSFPCFTD